MNKIENPNDFFDQVEEGLIKITDHFKLRNWLLLAYIAKYGVEEFTAEESQEAQKLAGSVYFGIDRGRLLVKKKDADE